MADTDVRVPRRKKGLKRPPKEAPFPVPIQSITCKEPCSDRWYYYTGYFRDNCVVIEDLGDLTFLYKMGFFGKGFLSRSKPEHEVISNISQKAFSKSEKLRRLRPKEREIRQSKFRVIRKERFKNHKQWWEQATGECLEDGPVIAENVEENSVTECLQHEKETTCDSETMQENPLVEEDKNPLPKRIKMDSALSNDVLLLNQPEFHPDVSHDEEIRMHSSDDEDISNSNSEDATEASIANKQMEEVIRDVVRNSNQCKPDKVSEETIQTKPKRNGLRQDDPYKVYEHLQLSLEEAFFLSYGLGCLSVLSNNKEPMSLSEMWSSFCAAKQNFIPSYITYHYFRSKGWVPKIGIKYGADLVLYKEGMPFYHSSYSVIVQMIDSQSLEDKKNNTSDPCRQLTWPQLCGVSRVSGHAAKEVMRCYVIKPSDMTNEEMSSPKCISRFKLQEVVLRRWIPERAREPDKDKTMKRMRTRSMNME